MKAYTRDHAGDLPVSKAEGIDGPLFLGIDTHALSVPACATALEVLAANGVEVMIAAGDEYTPTPCNFSCDPDVQSRRGRPGSPTASSSRRHTIRRRTVGSNTIPPTAGRRNPLVTGWIEAKANEFLENGPLGLKRIPFEKALRAPTTHLHDYLTPTLPISATCLKWTSSAVRSSAWALILSAVLASTTGVESPSSFGLNLTVVNEAVDPTFRFMTADWDGRIRMDPSSPYAMQRLIGMKDRFDLSFACDTDHDQAWNRHPERQDCSRPTITFPSRYSISSNTGRSGVIMRRSVKRW
jgi:phosphoglucomutase